MKKKYLLALAACLLLSGCGGDTVPTEQEAPPRAESIEQAEPPVVETIPPVEELLEHTEAADWQNVYAALLEEKAGEVERLRNFDRPDYDPNSVQSEIDAVSGSYILYDIDKDGIPELLFRCQFGWYTEFYGYRDGQAVLLGGMPSKDTSFYSCPEENAVAFNWARMGIHTVTKLRIVDGKLEEELIFEEEVPASPYTEMEEIIPGSVCLRENRTYIEMPQVSALTLPIYDYGKDRTAQPIAPDRDTAARENIQAVLDGGPFYGVSADGFGGDTGWTILKDYLAPDGVTPYNDLPMEVYRTTWLDFNGDGQSEALLTIMAAGEDDYEDTKQVIFSLEEDGVVYAYCNNYMAFYDLTGTVFTGRYDMEDFAVDFAGPQFYFYGVEKE